MAARPAGDSSFGTVYKTNGQGACDVWQFNTLAVDESSLGT